jgi:uncharacterized membrane protein
MANESVVGPGGLPQGVGSLEPRTVGAGRGASWWGEGWRLFTPSVGVWLLITLIIVGILLLERIPVLGWLIGIGLHILSPVLAGGLMVGCRAVDRGNPLLVTHFFSGFNQRTQPLIIVGLIYVGLSTLVVLLVFGLMVGIFGVAVLSALATAGDPTNIGSALGTLVSAVLVCALLFLLLWLPVLMLVWFAPALVMLGGMEPWPAMTYSFRACLKNFGPFLVYGAIGLGLGIVATIPLMLGWFVLYPVTVATVYASYCDIFEDKDPA